MKNSLLLDIFELTVSTLITIGTEKVISKTVDKLYTPETKKEKFIFSIGKLGLAMAADAGITLYLHNALHSFNESEEQKTDIKRLEEKLDKILEERNSGNGESTSEQ